MANQLRARELVWHPGGQCTAQARIVKASGKPPAEEVHVILVGILGSPAKTENGRLTLTLKAPWGSVRLFFVNSLPRGAGLTGSQPTSPDYS